MLLTQLDQSLKVAVEATVHSMLLASNKETKKRRGELKSVVVIKADDLEQYHPRTNLRIYSFGDS